MFQREVDMTGLSACSAVNNDLFILRDVTLGKELL
jgi:hypothetical protein